jgi:hypothetical protein
VQIKKISYWRKQYLDRHSRLRKPRGARARPPAPDVASPTESKDRVWVAPHTFDIVEPENRMVLLPKLSVLRRAIFSGGNVCLDFSQTEKMHAEGVLLFLAELRRARKHSRAAFTFTCVPPANPKVSQVLEQIGVFEFLGVPAGATPADDDVVNWRFAHSNRVEGEKYEDVLAEYDGEIAPQLRESLFAGITEAMTNVVNHAYDIPREDGCQEVKSREWWMFSQAKDGALTVVICDLGAGIPRTLPLKRPTLWNKLIRFGRSSDSQAIDYAVQDSISRTKLDYRGKGLGQIVRAVAADPEGIMAIHSNRGAVVHRHGRAPHREEYAQSILGTLIYWKLPLRPQEDV